MTNRVLLPLLIILSLLIGACGQVAAPPAENAQVESAPAAAQPAEQAAAPASAPEAAAKEAPMLAEMVAAGQLPPLEERIPQEPFIVGPGVIVPEDALPDWMPGRYGGTLHMAHGDADWNPDIFIMLNEHLLMAPGIGVEGIRPNIVKAFEVNDDNTQFTFHLREGLKWSDGEPVTTEDVRFMVEDVYQNEQLTPSFPAKFRAAGKPTGEPMQLEVMDDFTFRLTFTEPYGGFLRELTIKGWQGYTDLMQPAHYLKQFHADYTTMDELKPLLEEAGLTDEWWQLFSTKNCQNWDLTRTRCIGMPVLYPWISVEPEGAGVISFVRNPYYFKVDTAGQQLPYIDKVISVLTGDSDMVNLKVLTGDVDLLREDTALVKMPLYKENEAQGGFQVQLLDNHVDPTALYLNLTFDDPVWREVTGDLRFRQALNMAINRQEIIDSVYFGLASLPELVPAEYNLEQANQLLDEMGMDQRDEEGFRLGPDGNTFVLPIETASYAPDVPVVSELLVEHFKDIGIKTTFKLIDSSLAGQRVNANEAQASVIWSVQPMWRNGTWTDYLPSGRWGQLWDAWYKSNGAEGEEPPAPVKRLYELHEGRIAVAPATEEDKALTDEIYQIHHDNIYIFNIAEQVRYALVTNAKLGNVPSGGQAIGANNSGEQFFYKE
ncbi:MAG: ABC transporter substrate-binding protein [Caldilineaceae bacterium]